MNILYLAHRIPYPPNKGDKLRAFRQIERLARRHRVWCACFIDDPREFHHIRDLRRYCTDVGTVEIKPFWAKIRGLASLANGRTVTQGFYASRAMAELLSAWQSQVRFDAVLAFSSSMAEYGLQVNAPRRLLDLCDLDSLKWRDYADHLRRVKRHRIRDRIHATLYRAESRRLAAAELRWIDRFDAVTLATDDEAASLRSLVGSRKLHIVGNGIDVPAMDRESRRAREGCPVIGFIGVMDYFPNIDAVTWFASECWPAIRAQFPAATFRIVGRSPTSAVRKLSTLPGIEVVGEVPEVSGELNNFDVSIAPLRIARGVQNKVLEAMAAARPVVLTSQAAKGVAAKPGDDFLVADSADQFSATVCRLLADPALRDSVGQSARQFVGDHRRWDTELDKLEALIAVGQDRPSRPRELVLAKLTTSLHPLLNTHVQPAEQDQYALV
jgi:sugar transferase (PEP-CTERM/EpsH1 system associated)